MSAAETVLSTELNGLRLVRRGKVRDIYDAGPCLVIVATDRVSAFDVVLPDAIPGKGKALTRLSAFWLRSLEDVFPNHFLSAVVEDFPPPFRRHRRQLDGRSMLVRKADPLPVECIVRGYLAGSAWAEYRADGSVCGISLPSGLRESERLPEPVFTPSTKAPEGEHDENITFAEMENLVGTEVAQRLRQASLALYTRAGERALESGFLIADTKFEFGVSDGEIVLIDEAFTPDSSRFWRADIHRPGEPQDSYDKQIVRDYLDSIGWDRKPPAPHLPPEVIQLTARRYWEIGESLVGPELVVSP